MSSRLERSSKARTSKLPSKSRPPTRPVAHCPLAPPLGPNPSSDSRPAAPRPGSPSPRQPLAPAAPRPGIPVAPHPLLAVCAAGLFEGSSNRPLQRLQSLRGPSARLQPRALASPPPAEAREHPQLGGSRVWPHLRLAGVASCAVLKHQHQHLSLIHTSVTRQGAMCVVVGKYRRVALSKG